MFERGLATNQDDPLSAAAAAPSAAASAAADTGNDALQCVQIMGGMSKEDRTDAVVQFMTNQAVKIILVSFGQGAAGLTLTAANHVFLLGAYAFSLRNRRTELTLCKDRVDAAVHPLM